MKANFKNIVFMMISFLISYHVFIYGKDTFSGFYNLLFAIEVRKNHQ